MIKALTWTLALTLWAQEPDRKTVVDVLEFAPLSRKACETMQKQLEQKFVGEDRAGNGLPQLEVECKPND